MNQNLNKIIHKNYDIFELNSQYSNIIEYFKYNDFRSESTHLAVANNYTWISNDNLVISNDNSIYYISFYNNFFNLYLIDKEDVDEDCDDDFEDNYSDFLSFDEYLILELDKKIINQYDSLEKIISFNEKESLVFDLDELNVFLNIYFKDILSFIQKNDIITQI